MQFGKKILSPLDEYCARYKPLISCELFRVAQNFCNFALKQFTDMNAIKKIFFHEKIHFHGESIIWDSAGAEFFFNWPRTGVEFDRVLGHLVKGSEILLWAVFSATNCRGMCVCISLLCGCSK